MVFPSSADGKQKSPEYCVSEGGIKSRQLSALAPTSTTLTTELPCRCRSATHAPNSSCPDPALCFAHTDKGPVPLPECALKRATLAKTLQRVAPLAIPASPNTDFQLLSVGRSALQMRNAKHRGHGCHSHLRSVRQFPATGSTQKPLAKGF